LNAGVCHSKSYLTTRQTLIGHHSSLAIKRANFEVHSRDSDLSAVIFSGCRAQAEASLRRLKQRRYSLEGDME
jgi:hypothetical protein